MTTRETLTSILADLDAFYCDPALNVLYISVFEDSEDIEELEALFDFIGAHSDFFLLLSRAYPAATRGFRAISIMHKIFC